MVKRCCLHCYAQRGEIVVEDEGHVLAICPAYRVPRDRMYTQLSSERRAAFRAVRRGVWRSGVPGGAAILTTLLGAGADDGRDAHHVGAFLAAARKLRVRAFGRAEVALRKAARARGAVGLLPRPP